MPSLPKIYCALDTSDLDRAVALARAMGQAGASIKLGLEFFNAHGPGGVEAITDAASNLPFFLDLKYHDIPNTVAGAVRSVMRVKPHYLNLHASGGMDMMRAAREAAIEESAKLGFPKPKILGVTVLTSLDNEDLESIGQRAPAEDQVKRLAELSQLAGMDGVVCSPQEISIVRQTCGQDFVLMVPGIRPADSACGDQKRTMTPREAMKKGATHLVIGRPITSAPDPGAAAKAILDSLK